MNQKQMLAVSLKLQGHLEKKSTNFFIGFQERFWKIMEKGTKIGYKTTAQGEILPEKTWKISEVQTQQVEEERCFLLHTPSRVYQLRADSEQTRKLWMRGIAVLKRQLRRTSKQVKSGKVYQAIPHYSPSPNDSTLPSIDPLNQLNMTSSGLNQTLPPRFTSVTASKLTSSFYASKSFLEDELKQRFGDFLKKMAAPYVHYHVLIAKLTTKSKELFLNSAAVHYYILFSSKSLSPQEWISEENLTSAQLPHWADPDGLYRIQGNQGRLTIKMDKISEIVESDVSSSIKITTSMHGQQFQFFCDSLAARKKIKQALQIGRINALQSLSGGGSKRNYDTLILLHASNLQEFSLKVANMIAPLLPSDHSYEPSVIKKLIGNFSPFIIEVVGRLESKVTVPTNVIVDFLRILHEEVRRHLKLVWDSNAGKAKGGDILNILKSVSTYESIVNKYVKDSEMEDALKQLSKLYMRVCFKNFETIILGIVMQERKDNYYTVQQQGEQPYLATHGVTDLFKFIYDVFQLAIPCWNNKLHLHNINRLVRRALSVFVKQLKATVDEEDISPKQLIAISNNYVVFSEQVDEFYDSKLSELKEQTKEAYDELRNQYREIAMIVVDKLVLPLKIQLKIYFQKMTYYSANMEETYKKVVESGVKEYANNAHFIFRKRYFERVFGTVREEICKMMEKQAKKITKKKPQLNKIIERLEGYKKDCIQMAMILSKSKLKLEREFEEIRILLTTTKRQQIRMILSESSQFYKRVYKNILIFRPDYSQGSPLSQYINSIQADPQLLPPAEAQDRRRSSFSKYYIQQMQRGSITSSIQKQKLGQRERSQSGQEKIRMISEGYVRRSKHQTGTYEDIYLKLKKSVLYIYQNQRMQRCQNTIQIQSIIQVTIPNPQKPVFLIQFTALNREKQMRIKCKSLQQCNRWVYSLQLELRRINNDRRMKKVVKIKEKKSKLVIDYDQLMNGNDYFSYNA